MSHNVPQGIEGYLTELDRTLSGPASAKADLLAEARDGLHDAAEAYRDGGWEAAEAEHRAVAEFGPVRVVAREYQAELGMQMGIRTLWQLIIGVPLMQLAWDMARILTFGDWTKLDTPTPSWYGFVAHFTHGAVFVVPVLGLGLLAGMRWHSRKMDGSRLVRMSARLIVVAVEFNMLSVALLIIATGIVDAGRLFLTVPCGLLMLAWVALSARLVVLARRSWGGCATIVA
ncbi:permease prefix domain 1-containing protein [Amycolatopsis sp. NPDC059027]|uniref:permease prefix domain 1-containing protein n=1 Tax=unclassified Amycolatopsis TaxID=2618356 RepID=UPI00366EB227